MGNARTFVVWLVVLSLQLAPRVTYADVGPGQEVRAIRHDLPIILSSQIAPKDLSVDAVVVSGTDALVQTRTPNGIRVVLLSKRLRAWWIENDVGIDPNGLATSSCRKYAAVTDSDGITPGFLQRLEVPQRLIDLASTQLPLAIESARRASPLNVTTATSSHFRGLCSAWPPSKITPSTCISLVAMLRPQPRSIPS